jgi:hypothetical protein
MYTHSSVQLAMRGNLIGMVFGALMGGLLGGWPGGCIGLLLGGMLGCIAYTLHEMERTWQSRWILTVFGGTLVGLLLSLLLGLPVVRLWGNENLLGLLMLTAVGILGGALMGVAAAMRLFGQTAVAPVTISNQ